MISESSCLPVPFFVPYHSVMSVPSTTSYLPLDSDAPSAFRSVQMNNYVCGAWCLSYNMVPTPSHIWWPVAFSVRFNSARKLLAGPDSLDVAAVRSHYHIRYGGMVLASWFPASVNDNFDDQVEWIWTSVKWIECFSPCSDPILKAPMATAKDYIPHKSLSSYFAHCVRSVYLLFIYSHTRK